MWLDMSYKWGSQTFLKEIHAASDGIIYSTTVSHQIKVNGMSPRYNFRFGTGGIDLLLKHILSLWKFRVPYLDFWKPTLINGYLDAVKLKVK